MPKPTLLQSILGKPSQTYHHPAEREYHSTKDELFRIANATKVLPGHFSCSESGFDSTPGNSDTEQHNTQKPTLARAPSVVSSDGASGSLGSSQTASASGPSRKSAAVSVLRPRLSPVGAYHLYLTDSYGRDSASGLLSTPSRHLPLLYHSRMPTGTDEVRVPSFTPVHHCPL